jgi:hypothetical protein
MVYVAYEDVSKNDEGTKYEKIIKLKIAILLQNVVICHVQLDRNKKI